MAPNDETRLERPVVYVVDDDPSILEWITAVVESVQLPVMSFSAAHDLLEAFVPDRSGCVVTDLRMPRMSGLELQERLNELGSVCPVILISAHGEVAAAVKAMKAGAIDFLEKPFGAQDLIDRINGAIALSDARVREIHSHRDVRARFERLTDRERDTLRGIVDGKANKVMAIDLGISEKTVEDRRARVMRKMEAGSVAELIRMVVECGLFPHEDATH
jgi:FixJ family two-component response regulator